MHYSIFDLDAEIIQKGTLIFTLYFSPIMNKLSKITDDQKVICNKITEKINLKWGDEI